MAAALPVRQKLLITGATGFLGWNLCQIAQKNWEVYGTCFSKSVNLPGTTLYPLDLRDYQCLKEFLAELKPDAVIHTAAHSQPKKCQQHPQESYAINVTATADLAGLCADAGIGFTFTSTDQVFDGENPPYRESDAVSPLSIYGEQKVAAETILADRHPISAICRLPLLFGVAATAECFLQAWVQTLQTGEELRLFTDEFRTPASVTTAAKGLLLVLEQQVQGVIHLGGKERLSRYAFGQILVQVLQLDVAKLHPCAQQDLPMLAPRPKDVSLDSAIAFSLGYAPASIQAELAALADKL